MGKIQLPWLPVPSGGEMLLPGSPDLTGVGGKQERAEAKTPRRVVLGQSSAFSRVPFPHGADPKPGKAAFRSG